MNLTLAPMPQIVVEDSIHEALPEGGTTVLNIDAEGTVVSVNADFERTAGYSRYAVLGRSIADLGASRDVPLFGIVRSALRDARTRAGYAFHECLEVRGRSAEISVFPVVDSAGSISHFVAVKRDFTVFHRDRQVDHREAGLDRIGRVVGAVSHHFNNLLMAILGHAKIAIGRLPEGEAARTSAEMIVRSGERGAGMVRRLLGFGRRLPLRPAQLDLNTLVADLAPRIEGIVGRDIDLETHLEPGLCPVYADPEQLERLLMDLVANAWEAMPDGGCLSIETAVVSDGRLQAIQGPPIAPRTYAVLTVRDDGVGMDAETRSLAFEPFFTTKSSNLGLGLSSAYGFVKQSGGHIRVHGRPGKGASVTVYLPCGQEEA